MLEILTDAADGLLKVGVKLLIVIVAGVFGFLWWLWKNENITSAFKKAVDAENSWQFETLLQKHHKSLCDKENSALQDIFVYLLEQNSMACMKVLFARESAATWQSRYVAIDADFSHEFGPLTECMNRGTPEMFRFLLEQGMKAETESISPWLWAVSCGLVAHARILDEFGADTITPEQQRDEKTLEEELLDEECWEEDPQIFLEVVHYLNEKGIPVPEQVQQTARLLAESNS